MHSNFNVCHMTLDVAWWSLCSNNTKFDSSFRNFFSYFQDFILLGSCRHGWKSNSRFVQSYLFTYLIHWECRTRLEYRKKQIRREKPWKNVHVRKTEHQTMMTLMPNRRPNKTHKSNQNEAKKKKRKNFLINYEMRARVAKRQLINQKAIWTSQQHYTNV